MLIDKKPSEEIKARLMASIVVLQQQSISTKKEKNTDKK